MSFTVIPAIDLKDGRCVRLHQGDLQAVTVYDDDPAARARTFAQAGFKRLHVVDLDGAAAGKPVNVEAVRAVLQAADGMKVQIGGGIRTHAAVEEWLSIGADRVILGTVAVKNPDLMRAVCAAFAQRVIVGIDARDGRVATEGWLDSSASHSAVEVGLRARDAGAVEIIYTDIGRDGTLSGLNLPATVALADALDMPVIASGGLSGPADLTALRALAHRHVQAAIAGKAIYDGRLSLAEAAAA